MGGYMSRREILTLLLNFHTSQIENLIATVNSVLPTSKVLASNAQATRKHRLNPHGGKAGA